MKHTNQREIPRYQVNAAEEGDRASDAPGKLAQSHPIEPPRHRLLRLPAVQSRTSLGRTSIYQMVKLETFPRPIKVGGASLWIDSEVSSWIASLIATRDKGVEQ